MDRVIRSLVAMTIGILMNLSLFSGLVFVVFGVLAALLLCTSFLGACPFYALFHVSTSHYPMTPKVR